MTELELLDRRIRHLEKAMIGLTRKAETNYHRYYAGAVRRAHLANKVTKKQIRLIKKIERLDKRGIQRINHMLKAMEKGRHPFYTTRSQAFKLNHWLNLDFRGKRP